MSKVEWSDEARKNFRNTIRYIAYEFGKKAVRKFEANIALYIAALWDTRREPRAQTANLEY